MKVTAQEANQSLKSGIESYQVKVIGDDSHPANFGRLCVKGSAAGERVFRHGEH